MTSPQQLIEALERGPEIVIPMVRQADLTIHKRRAEHDEYNSYSVLTMIRHLALHDFFHA
jgi:hypothetical protein